MMYLPTPTLQKCGLTFQQIGRIRVLLEKWAQSCGPEWTVARLKSLKMWYFHHINGQNYDMPFWKIRNGKVLGPLGPIFRCKDPKRVLNALVTMYTSFTNKRTTRAQFRKFIGSVERDRGPTPFIPFLKEAHDEVLEHGVQFRRYTYKEYSFSGNKRVCGPNGKSIPNSPIALAHDFTCKNTWDFLDNDTYQEVIAESLDRLYPLLFHHSKEVHEEDDFVGRISVIQERGCKARFIAVPRLTHQICLMSLGRYLFKLLRCCPWDCTYDQNKGAAWAVSHLRTHKKIWSVDISDASNNFPLRLILWMLMRDHQVPVYDLSYFEAVSTGAYYLPEYLRIGQFRRSQRNFVQWRQGQPLGTYPSFPAFALLHGLMLRSIEIRYGFSDTFRVLGDDVVISNGVVYHAYRSLLEKLSIPVSEGKSLLGLRVGEFGGHVLTKRGSFIPEKAIFPNEHNIFIRVWREIESIRDVKNPEGLVAYSLLTAYSDNSEGLPLSTRLALIRLLEDDLPEVVSLRSVLSDDVYTHLRYHYFETDGDQTIYSRKDMDSALDPWWKYLKIHLEDPTYEHASARSVFGVAAACGLRSISITAHDLPWIMDRYPEAKNDWVSFCDSARQWYDKPKHSLRRVLLKKAIRKQVLDFKKTKKTIQGELLELFLKIVCE